MRLPKNILSGAYTKPQVFLCETDKTVICSLDTMRLEGSFKFNSYSEISFELSRTYTDSITGEQIVHPFYDKVQALRLIYLNDFGYFEIQDPEIVSDGNKETKKITAYSYEYILSQKYLENFVINTPDNEMNIGGGTPSSVEIDPLVKFYDQANPSHSLLHLAIVKAYGWSIGHVDEQLKMQTRSFEVNWESIYDFLVNDVAETFKCYFEFDTINNIINVYAEAVSAKFKGDSVTTSFQLPQVYSSLGVVTVNGYKTIDYTYDNYTGIIEFNTPPANNVTIEVEDGSQLNWNTDVSISFDNLASNMKVSYSADNIKTKINVSGADDMTITDVNMGMSYIMDLSYYHTVDWMGQSLYDAYSAYLDKLESRTRRYSNIMLRWRELINQKNELVDRSSTTDEPQINALKLNYFYQMLYTYYTRMNINGTFPNSGLNIRTTITAHFGFVPNLDTYLNTLNGTHTLAEVEMATQNILKIIWNEYGTSLLDIQLQSYRNVQEVQLKDGWSDTGAANYNMYWANYMMLTSCERALAERTTAVEDIDGLIEALQEEKDVVIADITLEDNFTPEQLIKLSAFIREDEYSDNNFIITDIESDEEILQAEEELLHCAEVELKNLCQPTLAFSMSMANIYALDEFAPIINQFQLGNVIRIVLRPDYIKKSRLMKVDLNFEDFSDFSCTFGDLLSVRSPADIHADLLKQATSAGKSVASNESKWQKASSKTNSIDAQIQNGLISATNSIKSQDGSQAIEWDNYGLHLRKYIDPDHPERGYDDKQGWIVNNQFLYSSDGFKSTEALFGEYVVPIKNPDGTYTNETLWGLLAKAVVAGLVEGSQIVGGTIKIGEREDGTYNLEIDENGLITMRGGEGSSEQQSNVVNLQEFINTMQNNNNYRVEIVCVGRNIMTSTTQTATLTCHVYSWENDITNSLDNECFNWVRTSDDAEADAVWNSDASHQGRKTITVSTSDITGNANFSCEVTI